MKQLYAGWWNLENLFDSASSKHRPERMRSRLASELEGWTEEVLERKIERLAEVIRTMNDGSGPDLLGVCEVENRPVLERLSGALEIEGRDYRVTLHESDDLRGVDVAFLYDRNLLEAGERHSHEVLKRAPTRDLFQVTFTLEETGSELTAIGNHWPARTFGRYDTEPYRIMAAETLSYWMEKISEEKGDDAAILVMGDFNDQPGDRSLVEYANSEVSRGKVTRARSVPRLYNLMWEIVGSRRGTYYYENRPLVMDQLLASKALLTGTAGLKVDPASVHIIDHPPMRKDAQKEPRRFGRPSRKMDLEGFSDHWGVGTKIVA